MELHFLLDEDTDRNLAEKLGHAGHDVKRVVEESELGPGTPDEMIRCYVLETDRILITHDSDHISVGSDESVTVFFAPNQRLESFTLYRIVQRITEQFPDREALPSVVFLSEDWL